MRLRASSQCETGLVFSSRQNLPVNFRITKYRVQMRDFESQKTNTANLIAISHGCRTYSVGYVAFNVPSWFASQCHSHLTLIGLKYFHNSLVLP
jgi:hypothetical protein